MHALMIWIAAMKGSVRNMVQIQRRIISDRMLPKLS